LRKGISFPTQSEQGDEYAISMTWLPALMVLSLEETLVSASWSLEPATQTTSFFQVCVKSATSSNSSITSITAVAKELESNQKVSYFVDLSMEMASYLDSGLIDRETKENGIAMWSKAKQARPRTPSLRSF